MSQNISSRRRHTPMTITILLVVLASLALAACGGSSTSSSSTSTATSARATTSTAGRAPGATLGGRFTALRECLQKHGITLPKFTPGQRSAPRTRRSFLPKGVNKSQYEAAVKQCGGPGFFAGGRNRFSSPAIKQALAKFSTCMREHGVNIPKANTSGKGPVFNSKDLNTSSAKFKAAETKCRVDLAGAFRGAPGAHGAPGAAVTPGASGAPPTAG
jgi:hypothetical protein